MSFIVVVRGKSNVPKSARVVTVLHPLTGTCTIDDNRMVQFAADPVIFASSDVAVESGPNCWTFAKTTEICCEITGGYCEIERSVEFLSWVGESGFICGDELRVEESVTNMLTAIKIRNRPIDLNVESPFRRSVLSSLAKTYTIYSDIQSVIRDMYAKNKAEYLARLKSRIMALPADKIKSLIGNM